MLARLAWSRVCLSMNEAKEAHLGVVGGHAPHQHPLVLCAKEGKGVLVSLPEALCFHLEACHDNSTSDPLSKTRLHSGTDWAASAIL
jgi:hypothetical protein